jgi:hypothetical protein
MFPVFQMSQRYAIILDGYCKIDRDVEFVAMVVHLYCKGLLPMFHLCFSDAYCKCVYLDVAYVSQICCICFI